MVKLITGKFNFVRKLLLLSFFVVTLGILTSNQTKAEGPTYISRPITEPQHWTKEDSPYVITNSINVYSPVVIDPGVVVKFYGNTAMAMRNSFSAIGTEEEKIVFTSYYDDSFGGDTNGDGDMIQPQPGYWRYLGFYSSEEAILDNVIVHYGSAKSEVAGSIYIRAGANNVTVENSEIKYGGYAGIAIQDSTPTIENCLISDSRYGIYVRTIAGPIAKVSRNSIVNNVYGAYVARKITHPNHMRLDARDNWWGDESGPYYKHVNYGQDNLDGKGNPVSDGVIFDPWLDRLPSDVRSPVILIPGIGASVNLDTMIGGIFNDNWQLFSHTYDGIIEAFEEMGYEMDKDFYITYYDWRKNNDESAENYLEPVIDKALENTGASKVNIIAHSMGGLVARSYIQRDEYNYDVDNLFLIGTPNRGSSDVYPVWEGGYIPDNWENEMVMDIYLAYLNLKKLTFSNYESVHSFIPSVKQLLPVYSYIFPKNDPLNIKDYSTMTEVNSWLDDLNGNFKTLNNRVRVSIISGNGQQTINGISIIDVNEDPLWADGKPDPIDPEPNDSSGDGRVLLSSSQIESMFNDVLDYNHGDIVSQSEQLIAERINEDLNTIYPAPDIPNEMGFWFASPVNVEITDPQGQVISGNINEIPLAKYASESKSDGFKIFSIPNPVDGEYEVSIVGNGDGIFHFGTEYVDYENGDNDQSSILGGTIQDGEERNYNIEYNSDNPASAVSLPRSNVNFIMSDVGSLEQASLIDSKEAKFILVKLKVIQRLIERIDKKEGKDNVVENYKQQINRQINWLIDYINEKSENRGRGIISQEAKDILVSQLESIKY